MPLEFPSAAWAEAFGQAINQNPLYKKAAASWSEGAVALVCRADPALGIEAAQAIILDIARGACHGVSYTADPAALAPVPFVIEAGYAQWKSVLSGELDPIKAMLQGQLRLAKGHLPTIIRDVESSKQLVLSARVLDTKFLG
ncbi:MAG: Fis family transcriptional regulator [Polyangiales bacterium]